MLTPDSVEPSVPDERRFIESTPDRPSPASSLFLKRFSTTHADGSLAETVVGMHVILAKGHPNGLWDALHVDRASARIDAHDPKVALRSLAIHCDTLEVRGELSVPEATVDIFARRLVWADDGAVIDTSPLAWTTPRAQNASGSTAGEDGAEGRHAGAIRVFARETALPTASRPRLVARGGRGQDPGTGRDGTDGTVLSSYSSYTFKIVDSNIATSQSKVEFSPPAVYVEYEWHWAFIKSWGPGYLGSNKWPTNGTNALAPGAPGNGGNGGRIETNLDALAALCDNPAGDAGTTARDYRGGAAGQPGVSAKYKVTLWQDLTGTDNAKFERSQTDKLTTKRGTDAPARGPSRGAGTTAPPVIVRTPQAWVHPLALQVLLEYARDTFLGGGREELEALLTPYEEALSGGQPDTDAWKETPASQWTAAQAEIAAMTQRLRAHLDYFGHPAGYTPLLSLPGAIKLYGDETKRALRMLLLTRWIESADHDVREAAQALTEGLDAAHEDSRRAAAQVAAGEAAIVEVQSLITTVEHDLTALEERLVTLRNKLLVAAMNDLERKAAIKAGIKMAGALCQVIPVGQPALGTVGSLASVAADFVGGDPDAAPDTLSKMSKVLEKAGEAAKKAGNAGGEAKKAKDAAAPKDAAAARAGASKWAAVGKGLGPAMSLVSESVKALQVPASEVEAALAKLESEDAEWNGVTREIRSVNQKKAALFDDLARAMESVGEGFARLASNAGTIVSLQEQRQKATGRLDPDAVLAVRQMGQRSRLTLQRYLYLMVKAYESTLLRPLSVDWNLTTIADKVNELLKPGAGFDAAALNAQSEAVDVLFQQNLSTVRAKLLEEFDTREATTTLRLGLSASQTPELVASLNEMGRVTIDASVHGLLLPTEHLARLSGVTLTKVVFDPAGPELPATTNAVLSMVPATTGTMRRSEGLYLLASDAPVRWGWTCLSGGEIRPATPSATARDVIDFILGPGSEGIKQKVALPPAWSELAVSLLFSPPLPRERRPRLAELYFDMAIDASPAPDVQRVLSVRASGTPPGAVTSCTTDLAGRAAGLGSLTRIYNKGAAVAVSVPDHAGGAVFAGWDVIGAAPDEAARREPALSMAVDDHVFAVSRWTRMREGAEPTVVFATVIDAATRDEILGQDVDQALRTAIVEAHAREAERQAIPRPLRAAPDTSAPVMGLVPPGAVPDELDERDGWRLVNCQGTVGWIAASS